MIDKNEKCYVAGHRGMVGSAVVTKLKEAGYSNIIGRSSKELDLTNQQAVEKFFQQEKPHYVILAAAKVGGIGANIKYPAEFLYQNLSIQNNVIHFAYKCGVQKLVFLGSSCIYPRECPQPMKEEYLLTGKLEPTNEGYAIAKIAGLKMLEYYHKQYGMKGFSVMPCNLYGTNDSFDPSHSHVLSALVKKFVDAVDNKESKVEIWGSGNARRELMHVNDCADAVVYLFENYEGADFINVGTGEDVSIRELAEEIAKETEFVGELVFDHSKPDGMPRKCLDVNRLSTMGFKHKISLAQGIKQTVSEYKKSKNLK
ncbi:MAG: GDP-L-fucose synthase [Bacteroidetes bacterium]|nr:GDP-L-fucose synthase [Bacteroidota bacterium]